MPMLIVKFLAWVEQASAGERAEATAALANAFLYADLDAVEQGEAERALTSLLDDPSPLVRRALAEALATSVDAPHHLVAALAGDQPDIAGIVLARSPILIDAELIDAVAMGGDVVQAAVARRPRMSPVLAGAIAEGAGRAAALALCGNDAVTLQDDAVYRVLERFGHDGAVREALNRRRDLEPSLRHALVTATANALARLVGERGWMPAERIRRVAAEVRDRATMTIAAGLDGDGARTRPRFVAHLRATGYLTPALLLRCLLSGRIRLFETALAELSGKTQAQVAATIRSPNGLGFAALVRKAGLPAAMLPALRAALSGLSDIGLDSEDAESGLRRRVVERVLAACAASEEDGADKLTALMRRFETEARRDEARASAAARERAAERKDSSIHRDPSSSRLSEIRAAA